MKVMIIGANGSIGQRLVSNFLASGVEVIAVSTHAIPELQQGRLTCHRIMKRETNLSRLFAQGEVDVCINASGSPTVGFSFTNMAEDLYLNYEIPIMLLKAIEVTEQNTRFINFSSAAVYGNPISLPLKETAPILPISPYGKHKAMAEDLLAKAGDKGHNCVSFRIFSAYGAGLKKQLFWDLAKKCSLDKTITLHGTGKESRDFIDIIDIYEICRLYIERGLFDGSAVNICSGSETQIDHIGFQFLTEFNRPSSDLEFNMQVRAGDPLNWRGDSSKLNSMFEFTPKPIDQGISEYINWFKELNVQLL